MSVHLRSQPVWLYNLGLSLSVLLYVKVAVGIAGWGVRRRLWKHLQSRKLSHLAATCGVLFWPYFDTSRGYSWTLNTLPIALYVGQLVYKGFLRPNPNDPDVAAMTRTGNPVELCQGPLVFCLVLLYLGFWDFPGNKSPYTAYLMGALGFGDGIAPLAGTALKSKAYRSWWDGEPKTTAGSIGMFAGTLVGVYVLKRALHVEDYDDDSWFRWPKVVGAAVVATAAEGLGGMWDNVSIAGTVALYVKFVVAA